ncbi:MAG: ABC transporter permease [Chloroflexi bacterium]|nr:ABC transporter permease [Chloroflexota bacterium]MCY3589183.1 ABC transporter permease [Chloroflexota bacterium]MCY3687338.1 ABC transporter permease [Chloroflexota bacterium]MDE2709571.1 ABC transporter permease [Chloroflexota bacterium]MDE2989386.1 ABC transporter permease [Chloroflexota bacterium]
MAAHLIPRLLQSIAVVFVVVSLVFVGSRLIGDPIEAYAARNATEEAIEAQRDRLGLLDPMIVQYGNFLWGVLNLDFGDSIFSEQPAWDEVSSRMWATVQLSLAAFVLILAVGVPVGVLAAIRRGSIPDLIARLFALVSQAMPNFWLGLVLIFIFAVQLGWLPTSGKGGFENLILPAITLAGFGMAATMRLTRSGMLEVLSNDYIRTAQAKGLAQRTVIVRHALRNALLGLVTFLGITLAQLLAGSIIVEVVFAWPGVGRLIFRSISLRDFPLIQVGVLLIAVWFVVINILVDLSYNFLDPRIRVGSDA